MPDPAHYEGGAIGVLITGIIAGISAAFVKIYNTITKNKNVGKQVDVEVAGKEQEIAAKQQQLDHADKDYVVSQYKELMLEVKNELKAQQAEQVKINRLLRTTLEDHSRAKKELMAAESRIEGMERKIEEMEKREDSQAKQIEAQAALITSLQRENADQAQQIAQLKKAG